MPLGRGEVGRVRREHSLQSRPAAVSILLLLAGCSGPGGTGPATDTLPTPPPGDTMPSPTIVVVAVGDIACGSGTPANFPCQHAATAALAKSMQPQAVLVLGDIQYEEGTLEDFTRFFQPTWGAFQRITYPAPGNHEYEVEGAAGYFDYFNGVGVDSGRAGHRERGYYAIRLGSWQAIALNSNCQEVGGCHEGSPQESWLRATLAKSSAACTLAFWHHPRFSSAGISDRRLAPLWKALQEHRADLVLTAHHHIYQRFAPLTWDGRVDRERGVRSFVVGTGGKNVYGGNRAAVGEEVKHGRSFGVLRIVLEDAGFGWEFHALPESGFTDAGRASCH
jgi:hypothetical protein